MVQFDNENRYVIEIWIIPIDNTRNHFILLANRSWEQLSDNIGVIDNS